MIGCPYDQVDRVREQQPIYRVPGTGEFVVTRFKEAAEILRDYKTFEVKLLGVAPDDPDPEVQRVLATAWPVHTLMMGTDPPEHQRVRRTISSLITTKALEPAQPLVEAILEELCTPLLARGSMEVVGELAAPFSLQVVCRWLGLDLGDLPALQALADAFQGMGLGERASEQEAKLAWVRGLAGLQSYFREQLVRRQERPTDDLLSRLLEANARSEEPLTLEELTDDAFFMVVGSNDTTASALASGILQLCRSPQLAERLRQDPSLIRPFVEEVVRVDSPVNLRANRVATRDTTIAGTLIPRDSTVMVLLSAANRDPRRFEPAGQIGLDRSDNSNHLGFGRGAHVCVGAPLARLELTVAFAKIVRDFQNLRLAPGETGTSFRPHATLHGLTSLEVGFDPTPPGAGAAAVAGDMR
jgi:cytochrome P450